jgi:hypothetical protein
MPQVQPFRHVIVTAFNTARSHNPNEVHLAFRTRPGWLDERFDLFERYCLPSVLGQTNQNFLWMIYFHPSTSEDHLERARRGFGGRTNICIKLAEVFASERIRADLDADLGRSSGWLVTTRLDNDDGLHRDFVDLLQAKVRVGQEEVLEFPWGIVYVSGTPYFSRQPHNAFISLSEPMDSLQTVFCVRHKEVARRFPITNVTSRPAWLQSIHGDNVGNKIRGWRIARDELPDGFEVGNDAPSVKESKLGILAENATLGIGRFARDRAADIWNLIRRPPWVTAP